jgi:hypothetical protein
MTDVTRILSAIEQGDPHAAEQLLPLVYDELRQLAARPDGRGSEHLGARGGPVVGLRPRLVFFEKLQRARH